MTSLFILLDDTTVPLVRTKIMTLLFKEDIPL